MDNTSENERRAAGHRARLGLALVLAWSLILSTGCAILEAPPRPTPTPTRSPDQIGPPVVVTVGGFAEPTATPGVAPTIPDATPRPRFDLPTRDAEAPAAPASSPAARSSVSAAARAAQPPPNAVPPAPRSSPAPGR